MEYTAKELGEICGVTSRAIRYFAQEKGFGNKKGKIWKYSEAERKLIIRHFSAFEEEKEIDAENAEVKGNSVFPGQPEILTIHLENAEIRISEQQERLEEQKKEIEFLRKQVDRLSEHNGLLLQENDSIKKQLLLVAATQEREEIDADSTVIETVQEEKKKGFWARLFGGK